MIQITQAADDRKAGMTLAELSRFLRQAVDAGLPMDTHLGAVVGFRGQLQQVSTKDQRPSTITIDTEVH